MNQNSKPWYKEPWPWKLAAGPIIVVIASLATFRIAVVSNDGLVSEDYYKQGLAVGKTIAQSDRAVALGLTAHVILRKDLLKVRLSTVDPRFVRPDRLRVQLSHPTRAGMDQTMELLPDGDDYLIRTRFPESGNWLLLLEDVDKSWRLLGSLNLPLPNGAVIGRGDAVGAGSVIGR